MNTHKKIEEIGKEVEAEMQMGGLSDGLYMDFAREVAIRYASQHKEEVRGRLKIALFSADNLAHIQNEPQSNQYIHLKGHVQSIIKTLLKNKYMNTQKRVEEIKKKKVKAWAVLDVGGKIKHPSVSVNVSQGWQCPICGCVWNWFHKGCDYCNSAATIRNPQTRNGNSTS